MKRKGISFWEQNVERIVIGVAGLFFVGFSVWQVALRQPNTVNGTRPGEIDTKLQAAADALHAKLQAGSPSPIDVPEFEPGLDMFEEQLLAGVSPSPTIMATFPRTILGDENRIIADATYVAPVVPAPRELRVMQYFDAIQPEVVSATPALQETFTESPYDLTWMTAAALFDLKEVRAAYAGGAEGVEAIPTEWYSNRIDVLDVRVEREELVDGEWGNTTLLPPLAGRWSFRSQLAGDVDQSTKSAIMQELAAPEVQAQIVQPPFYDVINSSWAAPDPREEVIEDSGEPIEILRKRRHLNRLLSQRSALVDALLADGGQLKEPDLPTTPENPGSPAGSKSGGGAPPGMGSGSSLSGGGGAGRRSSQAAQKAKEEKHKGMRLRIQRWDREIDRLATELGEQERIAAREAESIVQLMDRDSIVVWAHDVDLDPGRTYRYRFSVDVYNPFFARKLDLVEAQHGLAEGLSIRSQSSAWSEGTRAIPPLRVFVTKADGPARGAGSLGLGQASARVFRFDHGRWWEESFSVEPGDRIGDVKATPTPRRDPDAPDDAPPPVRTGPEEIDYGTEWIVLDVLDRIDVKPEDAERGLGAMVLLQSMSDGTRRAILDPRTVDQDVEYEYLRAAVEQAEAQAEFGG